MKTKIVVALLASALWCISTFAQLNPAPSSTGNITVNASTCATTNACVVLHMATSNVGYSVTASGTWTGTLTVEQSGDNQGSWTSATTTTANTLYTSALTPGITDVRVRGSAAMTGTAVVTITASGPATLQQVAGGSSSSSPSSAPNMGFYFTPQCQTGQLNCVSTFADTLENNTCSWTNASTTVTCLTEAMSFAASITSNVATYTGNFPANWAAGNSVTIVSFGDVFFNQTCTLSTATTTALTCPLVHANASTGTMSIGTILNNTVGPFTSADVGKVVKGGQICVTDAGTIGGQISTTVDVTIVALISSTQVTLSATPSATATLTTGFSQGACFIYGHLDDTAATTLEGLLQLSPTCPKLFMAAAYYFFSKPHFFNNPIACNNIGPGIGLPYNFGDTALSAGFEIEGRGTGNTAWFLSASFPNGDPCTHRPTTQETSISGTGGGCFIIPVLGKWQDFRIDGGPQSGRGSLPAAGASLIYMSFATLMNFTCTNMGYMDSAAPQIGIELGAVDQLYQVNQAGCGAVNIWQNATSTGGSQLTRVIAENATTASLRASGLVNVDFSFLLGGGSMAVGSGVIQNFGSTVRLHHTYVSPVAGGLGTEDTVFGYQCKTSGCILSADDTVFSFFNTGGGSLLNGSIQCSTVISCTNYFRNTSLTAQASGATYNDGTSGNSILYDEGGNTLQPLRWLTSGSIIADGRSLTGACTGVATASSTLALRISGTSTTGTGIPTTCTSTTLDAGIVMTQNRTLSTLQCSSSATTVSVACTVMVNGVASALTCTMTAATSCQDEFGGHSVAVLKGDLISERIVTGAAETGANIKAFVMWQ